MYLEIKLFLLITIVVALIGLGSVFWVLVENFSVWKIILKSVEVFYLAIPPELPVVMSMGLIFSLQKLKNKSIY